MNSIAQKYNQNLILLFVFAPFIAFFTFYILGVGFNRIFQLISYIGVILLIIFRDKRNSIKFPKYLFFYLLFILFEFYSTFVLLEREFKFIYLFTNFKLGALNMMFIIENSPISKKDYSFIIKYSKYILIIAFLVIIIQQVFNSSFFVRSDVIRERFILETNINRLHSIYSWIGRLTVGFGFIPIFIIITEELDKKKKKIFLWLSIGLLFAFLTKARWIMVNSLLVFFVLIIGHKNKAKRIFSYIFIIPILILFSFFLLNTIGIDAEGIVRERVLESEKSSISQKSAGTRILAIKAFNKLYWNHSLFGVGSIKWGMGGTGKQEYKLRSILKGRSSQIHVGYLSLFYMFGLIGGFFFLAFLYLLLRRLYLDSRMTGMWGPFFGFLGFAVANLTLVAFSVFEMGFIIALVVNKYYKTNLIEAD